MDLFNIGFVVVRLVDIIDICVVTFLFYKLYGLLRGSLAQRVLVVILGVFVIWKAVKLLDLVLLGSILDEFWGLGAMALVIIFAPEIRKFIGDITKNTLLDRLLRQVDTRVKPDVVIAELWPAAKELCATGNGALIVLTGTNPLKEIQNTGDKLNAEISSRLIYTIFQKHSPLHDGAMVIHNNRIAAVRCILPISRSEDVAPELGLRHRAALGLAEQSDALVIVVSEERREISVALNGSLHRNVDQPALETWIKNHFQKTTVKEKSEA